MQEVVKTKDIKFLNFLRKAGYDLKQAINKNTQFPICVDLDLKIAFRLTSIACLAAWASNGKQFLTQEEFFDKYILL